MAVAGTALAATVVMPAQAAEGSLEEVVVTAQKRTENLQDVPVSIQVLGEKQLEDLQIKGFDDYIIWMPTVSYTSNGPGYGQIYMRGIASGGDGNHSGSMPSVGFYLDEQPVTTINQILDVHVYDIERIETLAGPQGTLFGQGSQAGTIRIITNKPVMDEMEGGYDFYADTTRHGDPGYGIEGFINIPISDRMAVRLVGWHEYQGGWIDNTYGELDFPWNGYSIDNAALVKDNINTADTSGLRALLKIDLNDNWSITPGITYQKSKVEGRWWHNPDYVGDLEIHQFFPSFQDEDWYQASLTLEGEIGNLNLVYAGAYLDRHADSQYDYSGYAEYLDYLYEYLNAYYGYYYCNYYDAEGGCLNPAQYLVGDEDFTRMSHELRLQSDPNRRFRWIAGLFYQRQEHFFDYQWIVPDMDPSGSVVEGGHTTWQTNQKRVDKDGAIFGQVYFDVTDALTLIGGVRFFNFDNSLYGFNGWLSSCLDANGNPVSPCYDNPNIDDVTDGNGTAWKGSVEWNISNDKMVYATYSEGFRAGGVNRVQGVPKYDPDWVYNYEIGWKTTWAGGAVRFNGSVYIDDWEDFQFGFLDFSINNRTIIQNVGTARTKGVEWQLDWAPSEKFNLSFQGSYNDAKLRNDYWINPADEAAGEPPTAPKGTEMPLVPPLQLTGIGRFNFNLGSLPSFAQVAVSYRDSSWNLLDVSIRQKMDSYSVVNLSAGFERDNWSVMLYANNIFDKRGQVQILDPGYYSPSGVDYNQNAIRPMNFGIRWTQRFSGGARSVAAAPQPAPATPLAAPAAPPPNPDLDGDGVLNERDKCPNTRPGAVVDLDGCEVEAVISLDDVHFAFDSAELTQQAKSVLDGAADLLKTHDKVVVEVAGHTDSTGSEEYNIGLSQRRAASVQHYLESQGIKASRLSAKGYGEAQPVASNATAEGRALNRRVELIVLDR